MKKLDILLETPDFIAINKPAGLLSVPDRFDPTIPNAKHRIQRQFPTALIVHRLDKDTSGILLFAKNETAHREVQALFEQRLIQKEYQALVHGAVEPPFTAITASIRPHATIKGKMAIGNKGKTSHTDIVASEILGPYSFVTLQPRTGRTHQLRVHMAHTGHSILCDPIYGDGKPFYLSAVKRKFNRGQKEERPLLSRTALHAAKLSFEWHGESIVIEAELPKDMRASVRQLRRL